MTVRIKLAKISNALRIMPSTVTIWMIALLLPAFLFCKMDIMIPIEEYSYKHSLP